MPDNRSVQHDYMDDAQLSLEILRTIDSIDIRIDELRIQILGQTDRRKAIAKRIESLLDTRFKLRHAFMDINRYKPVDQRSSLNPFDKMLPEQKSLRRRVRTVVFQCE